jgi:hypothetical protein
MTQATINRQAAEAAYQADRSTENLKALQAAGKVEMDEYLAGFDAREAKRTAASEERKAKEQATPAPAPAPAPAPVYATWFTALLNERKECTDVEAFERAAYQGYINYGLSMTDGYYVPQEFEAWVTGFRKDPVSDLYYGNDARHDLAPQAYSYTREMSRKDSRDRWGLSENRTNRTRKARTGRVAHRFDLNNRAACNWKILPSATHRMNNDYWARQDVVDDNRYLICPRCDEQS